MPATIRSPMRIGIAACLTDADPGTPSFRRKTILSLEESLSAWLVMGEQRETERVLPVLLPTPAGPLTADDLVLGVDDLVLQGGVDVSPTSYGEAPLRPEWAGDRRRDEYESLLLRAAMAHDRPVLGICRGLQIINVALGGSLYQDLATQHSGVAVHRGPEEAEPVHHGIRFEPDSWLAQRYLGRSGGLVTTVHHQGIKHLGPGLRVEARSSDGLVEAIRYEPDRSAGSAAPAPFVYGVQWHPEYQDPENRALLPTGPLREMFLEAVRERARAREP